jgi:CubicO group peptidase (beta-lactamase class C family)
MEPRRGVNAKVLGEIKVRAAARRHQPPEGEIGHLLHRRERERAVGKRKAGEIGRGGHEAGGILTAKRQGVTPQFPLVDPGVARDVARRMVTLRSLFVALAVLGLSCSARAADLEPSGVQAAAAYSAARSGAGLLVIQRGKTLFSTGDRADHKIYSGTKGFWILAALAAEQEGIIDLDARVADTIPEWQADPRKARVTVRQLLSFTSGLEPLFGLHDNGFGDRNGAALRASIVAEPGTRFIYGPAALQVFDEYLKRKLAARGTTPTKYLEKKVFRPLGLGSQRYLADNQGNPLLASGFMLSPSEWAKEGNVILKGGGPVVSRASLAQCFRGSGANRAFGMGFWNNVNAGSGGREVDVENMLNRKWHEQDWSNACLCRDAPADLVAAIGSGNQRLYVVPSMDLVVVRFGNFGQFSDGTFLRMLFGR